MPKCKNCGRSGQFLSLNKGLCQACVPLVLWDIEQRVKLIRKFEQDVKNSKGLDRQLSKCDSILENAEQLLAYEQRGFNIKPQPSEVISEYRARRDALALSGLEREIEFALSKSGVIGSAKSRVLHLSRVLLKVQEYKPKMIDPGLVAEAEVKARGMLHEAQLDAIMEVASRAERKGELKKALGQYYEAQYFLEHEDIARSLQVRVLGEIRTRIAELDEELSLSLSDRVGYRH